MSLIIVEYNPWSADRERCQDVSGEIHSAAVTEWMGKQLEGRGRRMAPIVATDLNDSLGGEAKRSRQDSPSIQ